MRGRRERAHLVVSRIVLRRLMLERFAVCTEYDLLRPVHSADDQRRSRRSAGHPSGGQQRAQHHRGKREMDGGKAQVADHGPNLGLRPAEIKRQRAAQLVQSRG